MVWIICISVSRADAPVHLTARRRHLHQDALGWLEGLLFDIYVDVHRQTRSSSIARGSNCWGDIFETANY